MAPAGALQKYLAEGGTVDQESGALSTDIEAPAAHLATDDEGRASAWVTSFGGPPGTGWVALPYRSDPEWIGVLMNVADAGVWRQAR